MSKLMSYLMELNKIAKFEIQPIPVKLTYEDGTTKTVDVPETAFVGQGGHEAVQLMHTYVLKFIETEVAIYNQEED
jgi:hypothetical protein